MPQWHRGRVVLAGDAAWCLTLYSGMGASTGMAGADLLGTMIERHLDDLGTAVKIWEERLRPYIQDQQTSALTDRLLFVAKDKQEYAIRTQTMRMQADPAFATEMADSPAAAGFAAKTSTSRPAEQRLRPTSREEANDNDGNGVGAADGRAPGDRPQPR
ncbi:hypothetical protein [Actinoplanes subglobosus]|uniref:FAD-binding domain-containing protein n=1 Tax=Actinoplanes subglobosus TaxID=1547892 RepID=A0ABV8J5Q8_9ACTN